MENATDTTKPEAAKPAEPAPKAPVATKSAPAAVKKTEVVRPSVILKNTNGKEVKIEDYFFNGVLSPGFSGTCGNPVDREDLLSVFNKVFKPEDNILFYKQSDKEVYLVIVPIKYSSSIGAFNDSMDGDFQKHAISFLNEGSVNLDTLRQKLEKIKTFVKYSDR